MCSELQAVLVPALTATTTWREVAAMASTWHPGSDSSFTAAPVDVSAPENDARRLLLRGTCASSSKEKPAATLFRRDCALEGEGDGWRMEG